MKCNVCNHRGSKDDMWCPEFNKHLCDDCYTVFRQYLREMFNLDSLKQASDLCEHINIAEWKGYPQ